MIGRGWEMTWAPDGRATLEYGTERRPGEPHVIWRRIGTHGAQGVHHDRPVLQGDELQTMALERRQHGAQ
jgi:hypothetical protein